MASERTDKDGYALVAEGVTKQFGTLLANNNVTFSVKKGEVHALLARMERARQLSVTSSTVSTNLTVVEFSSTERKCISILPRMQ